MPERPQARQKSPQRGGLTKRVLRKSGSQENRANKSGSQENRANSSGSQENRANSSGSQRPVQTVVVRTRTRCVRKERHRPLRVDGKIKTGGTRTPLDRGGGRWVALRV